jgi:hydrogenase assembly chaperone HypC/HupF
MCLAIPGKVKKVMKGKALIEYPEQEREAFLSDIEVTVGDFVMVQMGIVSRILSPKEAQEMYAGWGVV